MEESCAHACRVRAGAFFEGVLIGSLACLPSAPTACVYLFGGSWRFRAWELGGSEVPWFLVATCPRAALSRRLPTLFPRPLFPSASTPTSSSSSFSNRAATLRLGNHASKEREGRRSGKSIGAFWRYANAAGYPWVEPDCATVIAICWSIAVMGIYTGWMRLGDGGVRSIILIRSRRWCG